MITRKKHFNTVVLLSALIIPILAVMDIFSLKMWQTACGGPGPCDAYALAEAHWLGVFWIFALLIIISIALSYYAMRRDISESLAIFLVPSILLIGGLEDILYFVFQKINFLTMDYYWLVNNKMLLAGYYARFTGTTVTGVTLLCSLVVAIIVLIPITKWLYKYKP